MSQCLPIQAVTAEVCSSRSLHELSNILRRFARTVGFQYFALMEHHDGSSGAAVPLRVENYPPSWVEFHDNRIGPSDPIWAVSECYSSLFTWEDAIIKGHVTAIGRAILEQARIRGVFDGVTVPCNVAKRQSASFSFATPTHAVDMADLLPAIQFIGTASLDAARSLKKPQAVTPSKPPLTVRQKECLLWVARGKGDWEIAQILGVSKFTVTEHLKKAQQVFDVHRRTALLSEVIRSGAINIGEI